MNDTPIGVQAAEGLKRRGRPPSKAVHSNSESYVDMEGAKYDSAEEQAVADAIAERGAAPSRKFGALRQKLIVDQIPGYKQRWIKDYPGRIEDSKECGYSHVTDRHNKPIYRVTGTHKSGGEERSYRMKIPTIWYNQAKMEEQEQYVDRVENEIYQGRAGKMIPGENGAYVPTNGPGGQTKFSSSQDY